MKGARVLLLRLAVSALLIVVLLRRIPLAVVGRSFDDPHWGWLFAAVAVFAASALGGALQWAWILRTAGLRTAIPEMVRVYWVGMFFNNFLLGNVGGDAIKVVDLGRREGRTGTVLGATALDRLIGLFTLTVLALATLGPARVLDGALLQLLLLALAVWGGGLTVLLSRRISGALVDLLRRLPWRWPAERLAGFLEEFRRFRERPRWLGRVFMLSIVVQFMRVLTHLLVGWGLGLHFGQDQILKLLVGVPVLGILIAMPISINGLGLREIAAASLFVTLGVTAAEAPAVAMEFVAWLVQVAVSLVGGFLFLTGRRRSA